LTETAGNSGSWRAWHRKTRLEIFLCLLPLFLFSALGIYPVLYAVNSDIAILFISGFPPHSRHFLTISLCLTVEMTFHVILLTWTVFTLFMILSSVLTTNLAIREQVQNIRYFLFLKFSQFCQNKFIYYSKAEMWKNALPLVLLH
jgi:hypothetical protein